LVICPDTNILIWLLDNLTTVERGWGLLEGPLIGDEWQNPIEALGALLELWYWRDI
jgi:hypothetical protein